MYVCIRVDVLKAFRLYNDFIFSRDIPAKLAHLQIKTYPMLRPITVIPTSFDVATIPPTKLSLTFHYCRPGAGYYYIRVRLGVPMTCPPCIYSLIFFVDQSIHEFVRQLSTKFFYQLTTTCLILFFRFTRAIMI